MFYREFLYIKLNLIIRTGMTLVIFDYILDYFYYQCYKEQFYTSLRKGLFKYLNKYGGLVQRVYNILCKQNFLDKLNEDKQKEKSSCIISFVQTKHRRISHE